MSAEGELRRVLGELEGLVAHPGYHAFIASVARSQNAAHDKTMHQATDPQARGEHAAAWRAYDDVMTLADRTIERIREQLDQGE